MIPENLNFLIFYLKLKQTVDFLNIYQKLNFLTFKDGVTFN